MVKVIIVADVCLSRLGPAAPGADVMAAGAGVLVAGGYPKAGGDRSVPACPHVVPADAEISDHAAALWCSEARMAWPINSGI
jgi:hypothetical protein